jgi:hypothetical protein
MQIRAIPVLALLAAAACGSEPSAPTPQTTTFFVFSTFASPNITVRLNGQTIGTLTKQPAASANCSDLTTAAASGAALSFVARLGTHYDLTWDYGNGKTGSESFTVDSDMVSSECLWEPIDAPQ